MESLSWTFLGQIHYSWFPSCITCSGNFAKMLVWTPEQHKNATWRPQKAVILFIHLFISFWGEGKGWFIDVFRVYYHLQMFPKIIKFCGALGSAQDLCLLKVLISKIIFLDFRCHIIFSRFGPIREKNTKDKLYPSLQLTEEVNIINRKRSTEQRVK